MKIAFLKLFYLLSNKKYIIVPYIFFFHQWFKGLTVSFIVCQKFVAANYIIIQGSTDLSIGEPKIKTPLLLLHTVGNNITQVQLRILSLDVFLKKVIIVQNN